MIMTSPILLVSITTYSYLSLHPYYLLPNLHPTLLQSRSERTGHALRPQAARRYAELVDMAITAHLQGNAQQIVLDTMCMIPTRILALTNSRSRGNRISENFQVF